MAFCDGEYMGALRFDDFYADFLMFSGLLMFYDVFVSPCGPVKVYSSLFMFMRMFMDYLH